jgi:hypothetical protein
MRLLLVGALALASASSGLAAGSEATVTRWHGGQWTVWRIDRPAADRPLAEYPDIRLRAGDVVVLDAGGCATQALVWLPGTPGPVPLAGALRRPMTIGESAGPESHALRLGRPDKRCVKKADGYVFVAVKRIEPSDASPSPMDLVWGDATDVNGVALNPKWGLQITNPGSLPDVAEICFTVEGWFDNPLCSTQHPTLDKPAALHRLICGIGATTPVAGHVNWYPGTFEGPVYWDSLSFVDRDCNVRLVPPEQNAFTAHNPTNIKGEFDSRETLVHFATPWWTAFRKGSTEERKQLIDGKAAILSGFTGVDCEHNCVSEIHPVWVLAIHVKDDPQDDVWAVFMRNWGNEGFCSQAQHEINWPEDRFTLTLPWRAGATTVDLATGTQFLGNMDGISGWWRDVAGEKVTLTFGLPPPSAGARVHGELHLRWTGATSQRAAREAAPAPGEWEAQGGEAEALFEDLLARLTPEKRAALERQAGEDRRSLDMTPVTLERGSPETEVAASAPSSVTSRPDRARMAEEERRLRALLAAFGDRVPGPIGEALERQDPKP